MQAKRIFSDVFLISRCVSLWIIPINSFAFQLFDVEKYWQYTRRWWYAMEQAHVCSTNECIKTHSKYGKHLLKHGRIISIRFCFSIAILEKKAALENRVNINLRFDKSAARSSRCSCISVRRPKTTTILILNNDDGNRNIKQWWRFYVWVFCAQSIKLLLFYRIAIDKNGTKNWVFWME